MIRPKYIVIALLVMQISLLGQQNSSAVKMNIEATVVDYIEMITLADIDVGTVIPSDEMLRLDPRTDQGAGIIKVHGRHNASVQISYSSQITMVNLVSNTNLVVNYSVSGNFENDQSASDLFTTNPVSVLLNDAGDFYLWIGCEFSLQDLVQGQYDGDFIVEVDYN